MDKSLGRVLEPDGSWTCMQAFLALSLASEGERRSSD